MTCIAAVVEKGKVYIGADSAGVAGLDVTIRTDEKVFKNGPAIFGFTSSFRMGQLLRYSLKIPEQPTSMSDAIFIHTVFLDNIIACLKNGGYAYIENNVERGGVFLVGYKGKLYKIEGDFQVSQSAEVFAACGCGEDFALAVLHTHKNLSPKKRILKALETAVHFSGGVRPPFRVISL